MSQKRISPMPETWYMIAAVAIGGVITLLLRALPFAILKPLRKSKFVKALSLIHI